MASLPAFVFKNKAVDIYAHVYTWLWPVSLMGLLCTLSQILIGLSTYWSYSSRDEPSSLLALCFIIPMIVVKHRKALSFSFVVLHSPLKAISCRWLSLTNPIILTIITSTLVINLPQSRYERRLCVRLRNYKFCDIRVLWDIARCWGWKQSLITSIMYCCNCRV